MIRILDCSAVRVGLLVATLVGLGASDAHAQRAPDMATLDRGDGITKLGVDLGFTFLNFPPYESALRLEIYGQVVTKSGLGFYGALPLASSFGAADDAEDPLDLLPDNATAFGNLEVGGLYVTNVSPRFALVFRGGLALPTATSGRDAAATLAYATFPRMTDLALASDAWYVRLGISPLLYVDRLFFRADLGFDIGMDDNANELLRLNVGVGYDFGPVAAGLELANLGTLDDFGDDEDFIHTLAFTLRFMGEQFQPFLSVGAPLDDSRRDAVEVFIAGGIQIVP